MSEDECLYDELQADGTHLCKKPGAVYRFADAVDKIVPFGGTAQFYCKQSSWEKVREMVEEFDPMYSYDGYVCKIEWLGN